MFSFKAEPFDNRLNWVRIWKLANAPALYSNMKLVKGPSTLLVLHCNNLLISIIKNKQAVLVYSQL